MELIKKAYYYLFIFFNNIFKFSADDYNEYKALCSITIVFVLLITKSIDLITNYSLLLNYKLVLLQGAITILPLALFNYHIFKNKKEWREYERDYQKMSKQKKALAIITSLSFMLFFVWFCYFI